MSDLTDLKPFAGETWLPKESLFEADMPLYWGNFGVASEVAELKSILVRRPGREVEQFDAKAVRFTDEPVDVELMRKQHDDVMRLYREYGVEVHYVEETRDDRPNAIFCRDLMFMTPEGAILTRPGMSMRRGEERYIAAALSKLGVPIIKTINGDGIFEGANAMWVDRRTVILATGARTNRSGFEQVSAELARMGVTDIIHMQIPYSNIHIDGILNLASDDIALVHASQVGYDICDALKRKGFKILEAPSVREIRETLGINFVAIKPGLVVQASGNPETKALLESNGVKVLSVDISEILKGRGSLHCITAYLKRG